MLITGNCISVCTILLSLSKRMGARGLDGSRPKDGMTAEAGRTIRDDPLKRVAKNAPRFSFFRLTAIPSLRSGPPPGRRHARTCVLRTLRRAAVAALILNPIGCDML